MTTTVDPADRIKDLLWAQVEPQIYITREQYFGRLEGADIQGHEVDGVLVGITITHGSEFHFTTLGSSWSLTRADIRRHLVPILERHGCVTTRVPHEDIRQQRFNRILGFQSVGEDEFYVHMKLEKLRHA